MSMDFTPPTHALELSRQFRGALDTDEGIAAAATVTRFPNCLLQLKQCGCALGRTDVRE